MDRRSASSCVAESPPAQLRDAPRHGIRVRQRSSIRTVKARPGHRDVHTTMTYTPVMNHGGRGVLSPLDAL
jgi:hypothetical protein